MGIGKEARAVGVLVRVKTCGAGCGLWSGYSYSLIGVSGWVGRIEVSLCKVGAV